MRKIMWLLLAIPVVLQAQKKQDEFDKYIMEAMRKDSIPGVTFLVTQNGKVLKAGSYGLANIELNVPAKQETVYELASISKPITATAIMLLVEEGKLNLDSSISNYLNNVPASHQKIKLRNLLNHTSGIPEDHFNYQKLYAPSPLRYNTQEQLADLFKAKLLFEPGERFKYSNAGFFMQAAIIEKASGMPYYDFVKQRIFKVAGMKTARFIHADSVVYNRAQGYTLRKSNWVRFSLEGVLQALDNNGFGAAMASVNDIRLFFEALNAGKVLKKESFAAMQVASLFNNGNKVAANPNASPCGLSWFLQAKDFEGRNCISHSGHTGTYAVFFPESGLSVIYFTNIGEGYKSMLGDKGAGVTVKGTKLAQMAVQKFLSKP